MNKKLFKNIWMGLLAILALAGIGGLAIWFIVVEVLPAMAH